jgi:hypothetical protein
MCLIDDLKRTFFRTLPEDHRRRFAAIEAISYEHGGIVYISDFFNISRPTIMFGKEELEAMFFNNPENPKRPSGKKRIRRIGGGRKKIEDSQPTIVAASKKIMEVHSAGSPTKPEVKWTDLNPGTFAEALQENDYSVSRNSAARLLKDSGFKKRKLEKQLITGTVDPIERNIQFHKIAQYREKFHELGNPVFSVDTKKKEFIGHLSRNGKAYCTGPQPVYDHDFPHLAECKVIPHGIYDYYNTFGFITLGLSCETSDFVCDSLARCWNWYGKYHYPNATEILLTFDSGGANGIRRLKFKEDLIELSRRIGLPIRVAHYPPYTSKWNPIEHKLFSFLEKSMQGKIFDSVESLRTTLEKTTTKSGLRVKAYIHDKIYKLKQKCSEKFKDIKDHFIQHDKVLEMWNYRVSSAGF